MATPDASDLLLNGPPETVHVTLTRATLRGYVAQAGGVEGIAATVEAALGMAALIPAFDSLSDFDPAQARAYLEMLMRFVDAPLPVTLTVTVGPHTAAILTLTAD